MKFVEPDMPSNCYVFKYKCGHPDLCSIGHVMSQKEYRDITREYKEKLCPRCFEKLVASLKEEL